MGVGVCLVLVSFSLVGCDYIYRLLDKEGAEELELVGEMSPFEKNPTVEEIQHLLKIYGYSPGAVDGVLGLRTRNSIEKFQNDHGLKPSRFVDDETWAMLCVHKDNGLVVDGEVSITRVQELLTRAGHDIGAVDGKFGPKTQKAVEEFQKAHQLKVDGKIGYNTMKAMALYINQPIQTTP